MHNIVVQVDEPYASFPPLAAGQFVEVLIKGRHLDRAAVIPRSTIHDENTVWVVDPKENRLWFRNVDIARTNHTGVVIQEGLNDGEQIVISPLKAVSNGMKVRVMETGKGASS
jgi:multidrug efflux pump subunit AcrA (membrane-fusion protein)